MKRTHKHRQQINSNKMTAFTMILSTLCISICNASMVFVQNGQHKIAVDVDQDTTVADLVNKFCQLTSGVTAGEVMLTHEGRELSDRSASLSDSGICSESVLEFKRIRTVKFKTTVISDQNGDEVDQQIVYPIAVGALDLLDQIDRRTREQLSISDETVRISYEFYHPGSVERQEIPVVRSREYAESECGIACMEISEIDGIKRQKEVPRNNNICKLERGQFASRREIDIEIPENFGVIVFETV